MNSPVNSEDLARYLEDTDSIHKPWMLIQLRLKKLQERRHTMDAREYADAIADIHADLMKLGKWWEGRESEVFNP
ncbi:MAG: hypothetical protein AAGA67_13685 [Cyanobacteria bacterium P01_F01_bin.153]